MTEQDTGIGHIGVVGAGQMGLGIAHACALGGYPTTVVDTSPAALAGARAAIAANLDRQVGKATITAAQAADALARLDTAADLAGLAACEIVIEAATENETVKVSILRALADHLGPRAIIATNTSSLSITRLGAACGRPDRFIGLHFMNPVPMMALVEIIRGGGTSDETVAAAQAVVARLGKIAAHAADSPGFIVNRILIPMLNEAAFALHDGVGSVESIDTAMRLGTNQPMGPLMLADHIGLDVCLAIMRVLHAEFGDDKYRPCPLLVQLVEAGRLGRKSRSGFYAYPPGEPPRPEQVTR